MLITSLSNRVQQVRFLVISLYSLILRWLFIIVFRNQIRAGNYILAIAIESCGLIVGSDSCVYRDDLWIGQAGRDCRAVRLRLILTTDASLIGSLDIVSSWARVNASWKRCVQL